MPKKATSARSRTQRNKPKAQKSFELVRPEKVVPETEESSTTPSASTSTADGQGQALPLREETKSSERVSKVAATREETKSLGRASTAAATREETKSSGRASKADGRGQAPPLQEGPETKTQEHQNIPTPKSASARLAARRQAAQKLQQRSMAPLVTSEHFAYVRKDLIKIAVFAVVMITAIIVLYFMLGRA